jgi:hypothetical protein
MTPCQYEGRATAAEPLCRGCRVFIVASEVETSRQETEQLDNLRKQQSTPSVPRRSGRGR